MVGSSVRRALVFAYVLVASAAVGAMILLGFLFERVPFVTASARRSYEGGMFAAIDRVSRPLDAVEPGRPGRGDTTD